MTLLDAADEFVRTAKKGDWYRVRKGFTLTNVSVAAGHNGSPQPVREGTPIRVKIVAPDRVYFETTYAKPVTVQHADLYLLEPYNQDNKLGDTTMQDVNETTALPPDNTRIRSYEFYEVRTNLAHSGEQLMCRGSFETCDDYMNKWGKKVAERGNLYMLRVTLVRAHKRAGE